YFQVNGETSARATSGASVTWTTLERNQITRDHMGHLFHQLLQAGILSTSQFFKGFSETLEIADDMAIDIPYVWQYIVKLVNPV
ncbi:eukaryotic translation initiation factor 4 gamma 3 isoform X7, partial [Silurus asotus]